MSIAAAARPARGTASDRILAAAAECVVRGGVTSASMQDVADAAGVSKGLIHYHFRDKTQLLASLVEWLAARIIGRQRAATGHIRSENAVDIVWSWAEGELKSGDLRALVAVSLDGSQEVIAAASVELGRRLTASTEMIGAVYAALELTPRLPSALLAEVLVAFLDGMSADSSFTDPADRRVAFDAFWLALLSLGE